MGTTHIVNQRKVSAFGNTARFKDITPLFGKIGDLVWNDINHDGIQEAGEFGYANVSVSLLDESGLRVDSTLTDTNGRYHFSGFLDGQYIVKFSAPHGFVFTSSFQGVPDQDSNADMISGEAGAVLAAGQTDTSIDAGICFSAPEIDLQKSWDAYYNLANSGTLTPGDKVT